MRANERSGFHQTQVAKFAGKLVDRLAREFYDVAVAKGVRAVWSCGAALSERIGSALIVSVRLIRKD